MADIRVCVEAGAEVANRIQNRHHMEAAEVCACDVAGAVVAEVAAVCKGLELPNHSLCRIRQARQLARYSSARKKVRRILPERLSP